MPTYLYQCSDCKLRFDFKQSFDDEPVASCPVCQGVARRLFVPVPILFKGPGFYVTDSREAENPASNYTKPKGEETELVTTGAEGKAKEIDNGGNES